MSPAPTTTAVRAAVGPRLTKPSKGFPPHSCTWEVRRPSHNTPTAARLWRIGCFRTVCMLKCLVRNTPLTRGSAFRPLQFPLLFVKPQASRITPGHGGEVVQPGRAHDSLRSTHTMSVGVTVAIDNGMVIELHGSNS